MRKTSSRGRAEEGSILLDVMVAILLLSLVMGPFMLTMQQIIRSGNKQMQALERVSESLNHQARNVFKDEE